MQHRYRIAYLVSQYPATTHTFILREVRALRALGVDVCVISISGPDRPIETMEADERDERERTVYVKPSGVGQALLAHARKLVRDPLGYSRGLAFALRLGRLDPMRTIERLLYFAEAVVVGEWMRRERLTHVHTHFSSTVALLLARSYAVTVSATIHGPDEFTDPRAFHLAEKAEAFSLLVAISRFARSQIMRFSRPEHWVKVEVVPLGVDSSLYTFERERVCGRPFELLCVGRLAPVKAQRVLIAAVGRLLREGRDVRLTLVGDGPDRGPLEREVEARGLRGKVRFEGALPQACVRERLAHADAFALASFAEGVPVVLMEAMAAGVPCVATRITGVPELIRDGVDGLLVAPSDERALATAVARLMDDPDLARTLATSARHRVEERYNLARNVTRLGELFADRVPGSPEADLVGEAVGVRAAEVATTE